MILDYVNFKHYTTAKRFWVSQALTFEIIKDGIKNGIKNVKQLSNYEKYKVADYVKQYADWLIGINITRLLTAKTNILISFGRVQAAVLSAIFLFGLLTDNNGETKLASRDANLRIPNTNDIYTVVKTKLHEKLSKPKKHFAEATILTFVENSREEESLLTSLLVQELLVLQLKLATYLKHIQCEFAHSLIMKWHFIQRDTIMFLLF